MANPSQSTSAQTSNESAQLEALRQQFDGTPYPWQPLDKSIDDSSVLFHEHSIATAFYRRDCRLVDTTGMTVLDVGCGSGYKALALMRVNPGIKVLGIDLSPKSIDLAQQRAEFWGLGDRLKFEVLDLDNLGQLGQTFDYINCDETLYLCPDPLVSLKAMANVLAPDGILRANLHDYHQRRKYLDAQRAAKVLNPGPAPNSEEAIANFFELLDYLAPTTSIGDVWSKLGKNANKDQRIELIQANFLLQGDRGFTIEETFKLIEDAQLNWGGLVAPQRWNWKKLFVDNKTLPDRLLEIFKTLGDRQTLQLVDWLQPTNRLIDFWCSHTPASQRAPLEEWSPEQWGNATLAWHPIVQTETFHGELMNAARFLKPLDMTNHFRTPTPITGISAALLPALIPLKDGPQPFNQLVDRLGQVHPLSPVTQEPFTREHLENAAINLFQSLEAAGYLFVW